MSETFGALLDTHRCSAGLSQNALARAAGIDPAYVNRAVKYNRIPTRIVVLALAEALSLDTFDTDRLLFAAGHAPKRDWQTLALDYARRIAAIDRALVGAVVFPEQNEQEIAHESRASA